MGSELTPHVAVVGGGCAGLATAVALTKAGIQTTVVESSHQLGGRARGLDWQGTRLDNGQHILLGAYRHTLHLLQTCSVDVDTNLLRLPLKLEIINEFSLSSQPLLPAPLHILIGLLQAEGISFHERLAAIRFMVWLRLKGFRLPADMTVQQLLAHQPTRLVNLLWEPLCLAAVNTPLATASAQAFANVLRDSFSHKKADSDLLLPRTDLSSLIATPAAKFIEDHGSHVELNTAVESLHDVKSGIQLTCKQGTREFTHVIVATSPFRVAPLFSSLPSMKSLAAQCQALTYQPIYTIYLQYPANVQLPNPMCGLTHQLVQWVFDRGQLYGQEGLLAIVISAEGTHQSYTQIELANEIHDALKLTFPTIITTAPIWHKVVAEKRATFSCNAGHERPSNTTSHPRIYLAGDYVSTGNPLVDYPATIEGAIRSGFQAAEIIIKQH